MMWKQLCAALFLASVVATWADDPLTNRVPSAHRAFQPNWAANQANPVNPFPMAFAKPEPIFIDLTVRFDQMPIGQPPAGWLTGVTGTGEAHWTVEPEASAPSKPNVLRQSGIGQYVWCVKQDTSLTNGFVEAKFKAMSGREDQAAGVVWRWKDADDYYVARASVLENNLRAYHVVKGQPALFASVDLKIAAGEWHWLRVDFHDSYLRVWLDGHRQIEVDDTTITGGGAAGLWTKADSIILFDDFTCGP